MRGNRGRDRERRGTAGSIPAHAGEPPSVGAVAPSPGVYPRACGGTRLVPLALGLVQGLSPRMRGNLARGIRADSGRGSIPAHAGEPSGPVPPSMWTGVYPRACGEPRPADRRHRSTWVYPRACGGTRLEAMGHVYHEGLSPRMRGNPPLRPYPVVAQGSIPAHAGEPPCHGTGAVPDQVYPRACGGTGQDRRLLRPARGLSPRMRGNLAGVVLRLLQAGSIPAHAGEPRPAWPRAPRRGVYPRACGGTAYGLEQIGGPEGLSPRMRGNLVQALYDLANTRSIPAHAGEPSPAGEVPRSPRVYPRACGGTSPAEAPLML